MTNNTAEIKMLRAKLVTIEEKLTPLMNEKQSLEQAIRHLQKEELISETPYKLGDKVMTLHGLDDREVIYTIVGYSMRFSNLEFKARRVLVNGGVSEHVITLQHWAIVCAVTKDSTPDNIIRKKKRGTKK